MSPPCSAMSTAMTCSEPLPQTCGQMSESPDKLHRSQLAIERLPATRIGKTPMASARKLPPAVSHLVQLRHPLPNKESQLQLSGLAEMARRMAADQADGLDEFLNGNGLCAFDGNVQ